VVKKRSTSRRVTNVDLRQIVADNHTEVKEQLARIETTLLGMSELPKKVETLEGHRNWLAGAFAVVSVAFTVFLNFFHKGH
jgi:hypothetical protein